MQKKTRNIFLFLLLGVLLMTACGLFFLQYAALSLQRETLVVQNTEPIIENIKPVTQNNNVQTIQQENPTSAGGKADVAPPISSVIKKEPIKTGVHTSSAKQFLGFEKKVGSDVDIIAIDVHWGNEKDFPKDIASATSGTGKTVLIFWNPMDYTKSNSDQNAFHYDSILSGKWDAYISAFSSELSAYDGKIILAPFEEVNGNWVPWSGYTEKYGDVKEYKAAFRYLYEKFRSIPNVSFAWVVNQDSVPNVPTNQIENYYPGSAYVDIIGINGFNSGAPWVSFDDIFSGTIQKIRVYDKPIYITSFASAQGTQKADWIQSFFNSRILQDGLISGWVWFDEDKERDWRVASDANSLKVFEENLKNL